MFVKDEKGGGSDDERTVAGKKRLFRVASSGLRVGKDSRENSLTLVTISLYSISLDVNNDELECDKEAEEKKKAMPRITGILFPCTYQ